jgi:hypothetical protein
VLSDVGRRAAELPQRAPRACDANGRTFRPIRAALAENEAENCTHAGQRRRGQVVHMPGGKLARRTRIRCQIDPSTVPSPPSRLMTHRAAALAPWTAPPRSDTTDSSQRSHDASGRTQSRWDLLLSIAAHLRHCHAPPRRGLPPPPWPERLLSRLAHACATLPWHPAMIAASGSRASSSSLAFLNASSYQERNRRLLSFLAQLSPRRSTHSIGAMRAPRPDHLSQMPKDIAHTKADLWLVGTTFWTYEAERARGIEHLQPRTHRQHRRATRPQVVAVAE